jgi:putative Mg2+ transporter-C (MgtC) family protein
MTVLREDEEGKQMENIWSISIGEATLRLFLAVVLGGLIGWEREHNNHPAGFRTHILVSLGSALIMLLSIYGFSEFVYEPNVRTDPARLAAQVVSGIGFLGAGTILRHGFSVTGLTTAASLWVVSGIGLSAGAGFYYPAILTTALALISLELLNRVEHLLFVSRRQKTLRIRVKDRPGTLGDLATILAQFGASIRRVSIEEEDPDEEMIDIVFTIRMPEKFPESDLIEKLRQVEGVMAVISG